MRIALVFWWTMTALLMWTALKPTIFPSPIEVVAVYPSLLTDGLLEAIWSSLVVNLESIVLSSLIGLPLCYLSRLPLLSPVVGFVATLRFVGPAVFFLPLLFLMPTGHLVKVSLITLGMTAYLVTTMAGIVQNIPEYRFDDARTLRMSEWKSIWYVVIRGTLAEACEAVRDNAAIGWSMLMFVEGVIRSEGGVGVMMYNMDKHVEFASVYAIAIIILMVGICQDWFMTTIKKVMCPYA